MEPLHFSFEDQFKAAQRATVIVGEHGTCSYGSLWARDGTVAVVVGEDALLKEPQVLLYITHVAAYFTSVNRPHELPKMLRFALRQAAANFGLPAPE